MENNCLRLMKKAFLTRVEKSLFQSIIYFSLSRNGIPKDVYLFKHQESHRISHCYLGFAIDSMYMNDRDIHHRIIGSSTGVPQLQPVSLGLWVRCLEVALLA